MALPVGAAVALVPVMAVAGLAQQFGWWRPPVAVAALVAGVVVAVLVCRRLPAARLPAWAAATVLLVAMAAGVWAALTHGEHVAVRRDAGAYATYGLSLDRFGGVPIDPRLDVFDLSPSDPWVRVSSGANYQVPVLAGGELVDLTIVPQFLVGTPATLSIGWWAGGWAGLFAVPAIVGALALCGFAALLSLVTGPRATIGATMSLALCQPVLLVLRQTYSESLSLLMLVTAAAVGVLAVQRIHPRASRRLGLLAGGLLAANLFVRIDAIRELVLFIPVLTVLALTRHPSVRGWLIGLAAVGLPAFAAATPWSSPYVRQVSGSLLGLLGAGVVLTVAAVTAVAVAPRLPGGLRQRITGLAPPAVAAAVVVAAIWLTARPLWLVDRRISVLPGAQDFLAALQRDQGLPLDPTRTYAENSVTWLAWWVGAPAVVLALGTAAGALYVGLRAAGRGRVPGWLVPLSVGVASTLLSLYRPAITPDHPWADRRFVTTALPTVVALAGVALAWTVDRVRLRVTTGTGRGGSGGSGFARLPGSVAVLGGALLLIPPAVATWPVATSRTEVGQPAAARAVCDALPEGAAIIAVDHQSRVEWGPVLRAVCGVPLIGIERPALASNADLTDKIVATGRSVTANGYTPMVLAGDRAMLTAIPLAWAQVVDLRTSEPQRLLLQRPDDTRRLDHDLWLAAPTQPAA